MSEELYYHMQTLKQLSNMLSILNMKNNYSPWYFGASDFKIFIYNPRKCVPNFWIAIL